MTMEFKTTQQAAAQYPDPPPGEGWMLAGSANFGPDDVHMYWQRPKPHQANVCGNCGAMAFRNSKCIGCKTTLES